MINLNEERTTSSQLGIFFSFRLERIHSSNLLLQPSTEKKINHFRADKKKLGTGWVLVEVHVPKTQLKKSHILRSGRIDYCFNDLVRR